MVGIKLVTGVRLTVGSEIDRDGEILALETAEDRMPPTLSVGEVELTPHLTEDRD